MIVKIIILGSFLFVGLRLVDLFFRKLSLPKRIRRHLEYSLTFAELILGLAFISWVVILAYTARNYFILFFLAISFVIFIVPAFILIRDLLFGIFLKAQNKIPIGAVIEIDGNKGKIAKTGNFFLNLQDSHGNIKSYSYYKLNSKVISSLGDHRELEKVEMVFSFAQSANINELITKLEKQLLNTPWVAVSQPIIIEKLKRKDDLLHLKVGLFTLNKKYEENIKTMLEKNSFI
jgi:hypothetical protein